MLDQTIRAAYRDDGVVCLRGIVAPEWIARLREGVAENMETPGPFAKRYTHLPQVHLGAAFGWAVPMAFTAQTGAVSPLAWLLFSTAVLWAVIYDTQYAMVDRDDDIRLGIRSTAILFADADRIIIGGLQCLMMSNLYLIGRRAELGWPYHGALLVVAALFIYQQYLIRDRSRAGCFAAFLNNNWVGGVVFAGMWLCYPPATTWFN